MGGFRKRKYSWRTTKSALNASAIEASHLATQAGGVEVGHFVGGTASRGEAGDHQTLHGLVLLAAAGGKTIAPAPLAFRVLRNGAKHVLQIGEVARQDCGADGCQRADGAFAVLGHLLSGDPFATGAGFAGYRVVGRDFVRKIGTGSFSRSGDHDKIPI